MFSNHQVKAKIVTHNDSAQGCARRLKNTSLRARITNTGIAQSGWTDEQIIGKTSLNLKDKKVIVVGLARTGLAVARFLKDRGAQVTATDLKQEDELGSYAQEALAMGISLKLGAHKIEGFMGSDLVVVSPGVPHSITPLEVARRAGIPVIGEVELASRYIKEPIVAITGTNGKTTTTSLVGKMLEASGHNVFVGGNIGAPLIDYVNSSVRAETIVAEISSFQLDTIEHFRPEVGVLLNITEDHLDRYNDFSDYVRSKGRLFENQGSTDVAVLNGTDPTVSKLESLIDSQRLYFNINNSGLHGAVMRDKEMTCSLPGRPPVVLSLAKFRLKGSHNLENAAAASLAAFVAGGNQAGLQMALDTFDGLHHRLEYVRDVNGVQYYNDSKATNVDAVKRSLESFDSRVILIMGGRDKGGSYTLLKELIKERVKRLIAIGEAREKILNCLGALTSTEGARTLAEAVCLAHKGAASGDTVLLSPGCSSFDMFTDYAKRGVAFCEAVKDLHDQLPLMRRKCCVDGKK
ncbi:MAG: UDP-N-acetylmuramoyl-L-alanine--D-glutamate ligase [Desulfobacterales bacterium]|nr:MAG: UDP-N-acetylmuramoyl-L-alanine--D-glutamate ligase [Desulfobacterales bacterium]